MPPCRRYPRPVAGRPTGVRGRSVRAPALLSSGSSCFSTLSAGRSDEMRGVANALCVLARLRDAERDDQRDQRQVGGDRLAERRRGEEEAEERLEELHLADPRDAALGEAAIPEEESDEHAEERDITEADPALQRHRFKVVRH